MECNTIVLFESEPKIDKEMHLHTLWGFRKTADCILFIYCLKNSFNPQMDLGFYRVTTEQVSF